MSDTKVEIDENTCQGHAICYMVAPAVFDVDGEGRGSVINEHLPDGDVQAAKDAAQRCPESAIKVTP